MRRLRVDAVLIALWAAVAGLVIGCGRTHGLGPGRAPAGAGSPGSNSGQAAPTGGATGPRAPPEDLSGACTQTPALIERVDLLLAIDNSGGMGARPWAFRAQVPTLLRVLTSGDLEGDGAQDFPPARDLHVGIVSSDLAALGRNDIYKCEEPGDDGQLQHTSSSGTDCHASYPPFIIYLAGASDRGPGGRDARH